MASQESEGKLDVGRSLRERYEPDFERLQRLVQLHHGFVLQPVESPSLAVLTALAEFLREQGGKPLLLAPKGAEWKSLAAQLIKAPEQRPTIVIVYGSMPATPEMEQEFRLLNQQRDAIQASLHCPLLWWGSAEFLAYSWEKMPDVWSIRTLYFRFAPLDGSALSLPRMSLEGHVGFSGKTIEQTRTLWEQALAQGNTEAAGHLAVRLAADLRVSGQLDESISICRKTLSQVSVKTNPEPYVFLKYSIARSLPNESADL
jgi:hypothetical protein